MIEKNQNWWKPGVEIFSQVSGWIVAPIVLALVVGKFLDTRYGTKPVIFLSLAGIGFLITCFGIVRIVRKYIKDIKDLADKK
ncbi:hypothetical protein A3A05_02560 [Candidatus Nomurabacteria bacterium RIFCSPLOWO2_01_FULL_41_12]|uniref:F0F1-ATPase subunit n=1 Tax=Candidatus Nomurabacteria bacterium RIFCSPLOWO2_01_FULL_41_12 TaxID=1801774 RepID=A0A1F6WVQ8_9BACT|nr:MAG: hypothetical protein A2732_00670 [Candidatus Nomurabacteria bacterium RIFCSPHIGHO2_01_FULL_40_10]OGI85971.1 MAG: hypothetical protein A3A05_02560 [Candidatus Nomurabacteria bacterium RIFCSPLOWO2_01_FULL_41_12]